MLYNYTYPSISKKKPPADSEILVASNMCNSFISKLAVIFFYFRSMLISTSYMKDDSNFLDAIYSDSERELERYYINTNVFFFNFPLIVKPLKSRTQIFSPRKNHCLLYKDIMKDQARDVIMESSPRRNRFSDIKNCT